jgi:tetratricopeptide (TPR) repeat protein
MNRFFRLCQLLLAITFSVAAQDGTAIRDAVAALQGGDFAAAERILRPEVKARPKDGGALTLLGVALDSQKKFQEAGEIHRRAAANAPNSPDVWNNYGNHLLGTGDEDGARKLYLRVVALNSANPNANVQLARLALKAKQGIEALAYLQNLPAGELDAPNLAPIRIAGLYLAGKAAEADPLAARWLAATRSDLGGSFAIGAALADAAQFEQAGKFFTQALALAPADFNVLFNSGVVAWHSGDLQRARELLEVAQREQPQNVDVLYNLACVEQAARRTEAAVALLAQAARLAPQRGDVQRLLALATGDLGALADSAAAWDRYLKLAPADDVARRERGFIAFQMGQFEHGVAELRWFVARHPDDAVGYFELGAAENKDNPAQALAEYDRALALKADFAAAHSARGSLYYQMGNAEAALADLEAAAALRPDDAVSLDRLGQTYLALDRAADAVGALRKAASLAPEDSKTMLHLARALADAGQAAESKAAMDRFRQLGPWVNKPVPGGLVDYLALTPQQRRDDYRARVERMAREHPEDAAAQLSELKLRLEDGESQQAVEVARKVVALKPAGAILADAGRSLLEARQFGAARELLEQAAVPGVELDLAVAAFHASGPAGGMRLLERVPEPARGGDYYLARAEMLDASGQALEAAAALDQALGKSPQRAGLYLDACSFLLSKGRTDGALRVSGEAMRVFPQEREILLLRAVVLELAGRGGESEPLLEQLQNRWPEWPTGWLAHGIVLGRHGRGAEARAALVTAVALGAPSDSEQHPPDLASLLRVKRSHDR